MAEDGRLKAVSSKAEEVPDGHAFFYAFNVYRLDNIHRTFYPLEFGTPCRSIPTSWEIELKYEREDCGSYTFSIKLERKDSSNHRVRASFHVSFYDYYHMQVFEAISSSKDRMVPGDEFIGVMEDIPASSFGKVTFINVKLTIQKCHVGTEWRCASKADTDKNCIIPSKL